MLLAVLVAAVLAVPAGASAGNSPHPTLDAVATFAAGNPVSVYCENGWWDWIVFFAE